MRGQFALKVSIIVLLVFAACIFGDQPSTSDSVGKPDDGHTTASDTLAKEAESIFSDDLDSQRLRELREAADKQPFQAEVGRLMKLIINSLYKNKEIFLRELISNASDALDKIRLRSLTESDVLQDTDELSIRIKVNRDAQTIHITDTGIGMTADDLTGILGTIAKSGTSEFLAMLTSNNQTADTTDLIGQFGVGFYSSFLVADKVTVVSRSVNDKQYIWESDSKSFSIIEDPRGNSLKRGTEIILHISPEADEFLELSKLKDVIKKYSQFISFPIYLFTSRTETVKVDAPETEAEAGEDVSVEKSTDSEKTVEKVVWEWEHINKQKPVWTRNPSDVTDEEYQTLYEALAQDTDPPISKIHFNAEGDVNFKAVLFLPKHPPRNFFHSDINYATNLKLHVRRVFVADAARELLPNHFGFVYGIVDSDDLDINVSRETLQESTVLKVIKRKLVRKIIEMINKLPEDVFPEFWKEFSIPVKVATIQDHANRGRLAKILRFYTSRSLENQTGLQDYVSRMKPDQTAIYYITASSLDAAKSSPFVERLLRKGYEIVYMTEAMDEYLTQHMSEFDKKPLKNVAKDDLSVKRPGDEEELNETFKNLLKWITDILDNYIASARISERLSDSPCAIVPPEYGWTGNMQRIYLAQAQNQGRSLHHRGAADKKIFEINPRHPLIKELNSRVSVDISDKVARNALELLFNTAYLRSGFELPDAKSFSSQIELTVRRSLGVDENEQVDDELDNADDQPDKTETEQKDEELKSSSSPDVDLEAEPTEPEKVSESNGEKDEL